MLSRCAVLESLESRQLFAVSFTGASNQLIDGSNPDASPSNYDFAVNAKGEFAVVYGYRLATGNDAGIFVSRFNASGQAIGTPVRVTSDESYGVPVVALADDGSFVVAWHQIFPEAGDSDPDPVVAQRFSSEGSSVGSLITVDNLSTNTFSTGIDLAIAGSTGDFVITFTRDANGSGLGSAVLARAFSGSTGNPLSSAVQVNTTTDKLVGSPRVAMDADGDFAVTWNYGTTNSSQGYNAFVRTFRINGTPRTEPILLATEARNTTLDIEPDGDFATSIRQIDPREEVETSVIVKRFDINGTSIGTPVTAETSSESTIMSLSLKSDGSFLLLSRFLTDDGFVTGISEYDSNGQLQGQPAIPNFDERGAGAIVASNAGAGFVFREYSTSYSGGTSLVSIPFTSTLAPTGPLLSLTAAPTTVIAGAKSSSFSITLVDANGQTATADKKTKLKLSLVSGPTGAKLSSPTATPKNGIVTFKPLTLTKAGSYTLRIAGGTYGQVDTILTVTPAAVSKVVFTQPPANSTANSPFSASVKITDKYGNDATSSTSITLSLGSKPRNASPLAGTLSLTTTSATALFSDLTLTTPGKYTLVAVANGKKATSKKFTVT